MFEYLKGVVTFLGPTYVVVEVAGIGYRVVVANPQRYQPQEELTIYVEQIIRENEQSLYGFYDLTEKQLFQLLTTVSGIGPKSALAILADNDHQPLITAIVNDDAKFLTQFPGVGKKTAQQIILDLRDKLPEKQLEMGATTLFTSASPNTKKNLQLQDGLEALVALGYSQKAVQKIAGSLAEQDLADAGSYVRAGLQLLQEGGR
ncbi:Holliday junction branch migration protein RuvA [Lactobacillus sp. DCY120]|uniref:Holliday junction branch migration complex subunit RuvA n=1 Tax=Bombilactobacillus apium TaxID=2675299 RepID=A0A850R9A5_9LACO|nr:Holliday junction branch migration protein RuvA [Bombilactobacillus apium]NVY97105.1 Holliday junction branch migration protein RuvA [Bombilactobacillus apium]